MNSIVIPYRMSYSNELIYMVRSLKNLPHKDVWIIGDRPRLRTKHIPFKQTADIASNTLEILNLAINTPEISDEFIWMADDMFVMKFLSNPPIHHRGPYLEILNTYRNKNRNNYYVRRMQKTHNRLVELGVKSPLCYELHIPFLINKKKWSKVSKYITPDLNKLSMYANLNRLGGTQVRDVKVRQKDRIPRGSFISTHDSTFGNNRAGRLIRDTFSEKSKYEI